MNRAELVDAIANAAALGKREVDQVVGELVGQITRALQTGQKVNIPGIGAFSTAPSKPRIGRNPRTGIEVPIPAGVRVRFHASSTLKSAVGKKKAAAKKSTSRKAATTARKTTAKRPATSASATKSTATKRSATQRNQKTPTATKPSATKKAAAKKPAKKPAATKAAAKKKR